LRPEFLDISQLNIHIVWETTILLWLDKLPWLRERAPRGFRERMQQSLSKYLREKEAEFAMKGLSITRSHDSGHGCAPPPPSQPARRWADTSDDVRNSPSGADGTGGDWQSVGGGKSRHGDGSQQRRTVDGRRWGERHSGERNSDDARSGGGSWRSDRGGPGGWRSKGGGGGSGSDRGGGGGDRGGDRSWRPAERRAPPQGRSSSGGGGWRSGSGGGGSLGAAQKRVGDMASAGGGRGDSSGESRGWEKRGMRGTVARDADGVSGEGAAAVDSVDHPGGGLPTPVHRSPDAAGTTGDAEPLPGGSWAPLQAPGGPRVGRWGDEDED
jgi:hypothetical protein